MPYNNDGIKAATDKQVPNQIYNLSTTIIELREVTNKLEEALSPVLRPMDAGKGEINKTPDVMLVPTADQLRSHTRELSELVGTLKAILLRLEV